MKMTGSREGFGNDKPLWKQRRGHLLQFPDHKATEKENSSKNLRKTKEKERAKNKAVTCLYRQLRQPLTEKTSVLDFKIFNANTPLVFWSTNNIPFG